MSNKAKDTHPQMHSKEGFKTRASTLFMAKGQNRYCGLVYGPHVSPKFYVISIARNLQMWLQAAQYNPASRVLEIHVLTF
jgi:hypothetical protein